MPAATDVDQEELVATCEATHHLTVVLDLLLSLQLSELIRGAVDGAYHTSQHKVLLQQLHLLCGYIGLQELQDPAQQMTAVMQYVQEVRQQSTVLSCIPCAF
jgi:hypothetical protein